MAEKVLIVVDAQNDFITGALGNKECDAATNVIAEEIASGKYSRIIFTKDTHDEHYLETQEGKMLPVPHCIKGTDGWKIDERLNAALHKLENTNHMKDTRFIDKPTFGSINLGKLLKDDVAKDAEFYFCGFCTGICVVSNIVIVKTFCPENKVFLIENGCACVTPESHKAAVETIKMLQVNTI